MHEKELQRHEAWLARAEDESRKPIDSLTPDELADLLRRLGAPASAINPIVAAAPDYLRMLRTEMRCRYRIM